MKKYFAILTIAAASMLGMSLASCTKLQPTEVTNIERPITAHASFAFQFPATGGMSTPTPVPAGSMANFTITIKDGSTTYRIRKAVEKGGVVNLEIGCGESGASVIASMQAQITTMSGVTWAYGSASADLSASNKFFASKTVTVNN